MDARSTGLCRGSDLGRILRRERYRAGLFQREVSALVGIGQERLSRYESGAVVPAWQTFVRVLAALGSQPRIVVEPRDAKVDAFIAEQRGGPRGDVLADVTQHLRDLLRLLDGLSWAATRLFAARLHGAPVPLTRFEVDAVVGTADWERLTRNSMDVPVQVWDPEIGDHVVPVSPTIVRCAADAAAGHLEWLLPGGYAVRMRIVTMLTPRCIEVQQVGRTWLVMPLDLITDEDPWTNRILVRLGRRGG